MERASQRPQMTQAFSEIPPRLWVLNITTSRLALQLRTSTGQNYRNMVESMFVAETNIDLYPSVYYSHAFGEWGISAGYTAQLTNFANFSVSATRAEYDIKARRFSSETDLITDYSLFHEQRWVLGLSRKVAEFVVGTRLKWVAQDVKSGAVVSTLNLAAQHGSDVDVHAPQQLIEAIVEELQFGKQGSGYCPRTATDI